MPVGPPSTVQQIARFSEIQPLAPAVVVTGDKPTDAHEYSYRDLIGDARRLATSLTLASVGRGQIVAVSAPASYEAVVAFLAIWMCEAAYLPLDHFAPVERNRLILADAAPALILTVTDSTPPTMGGGLPALDGRVLLHAGHAHPGEAAPDTAYVIYTSGTTGQPKGVPVTHASIDALFAATSSYFAFEPRDSWLVAHSLAFDFSVWELWGALRHGASAVLPDRWTVRDPRMLSAVIRARQVTVLSQTPTAFSALLPELLAISEDLRFLRYVVFGGERLQPRFLASFTTPSTAVLYNMYGITEVTVHASIRRVTETDISTNDSNIGTLLPGFEGLVVDETGEPVGDADAGELLLAGPQVTTGYLNRPVLTASRFLTRAGRRFYRSGDIVRASPEADGSLLYLGRRDDQVQVRGHRVELGEVERAAQLLPQALDAQVVAVDVDGEQVLACAYLGMGGAEVSRRAWVAHLKEIVPAYMIPTVFRLFHEFPRTINGKVDRKALACRLQQPAHRPTPATAETTWSPS